ncbi:MAG TPA: ATP-dependent helicase HrpB [Verrucomicrobia bacterium]|nr:ATP-dependent helicase HrpB [Verrucomicrobiota bacterium]
MVNPKELPIYEIEQALKQRLTAGNRLIVTAPTGSGKSTQVPQILLDHGLLGDGQVVILQPRRLATRMLAARVAQERRGKLGDEVGYQIRFDNISSGETRIKFETEGILLRQMLSQPDLKGVSAIIFDEFHERHLYGDITLARALQIQETIRPDLKLIVMSATLAVEELGIYLKPCSLLTSDGRAYPVDIQYLPKPVDFDRTPVWEAAAEAFAQYGRCEGDVLVFMPGAYEISRTVQALQNLPEAQGCTILPLHGELSARDQDAAVASCNRRKIVVATNVAETSLTIDGIRLVLDGGLARVARFDPYRGINTLLIERISQASSDQRAGRAGRTAPGRCIRLWAEREQSTRPLQEVPEIKRLDLAEVVLTLKASGVNDVRTFRWLEPPEPRALERAEMLLRDLGALDENAGTITELGRRMLSFPVHPRYSRMLLAAHEYGCVRSVALIAALTQGRNLLVRRTGKDVSEDRDNLLGDDIESDFFLLMRAWSYADKNGYNVDRCRRLGIHAQSARQVGPLFEYFLKIAGEQGLNVQSNQFSNESIQKCVLVGFSDHVAHRLDSGTLRCMMVHGRKGVLARESVVQKEALLVAAEVHEIENSGGDLNVLLTLATAVKEEWLRELFPGDFSERLQAVYDSAAKRVYALKQIVFRDLPLESRRSDSPPKDEAAALLAEEVIKGSLTLKLWDHAVEQWIMRVNCLSRWCPDLQVPAISEEARRLMIQQVCLGSISYKDIKEKSVWPVVKEWLSPAQLPLVDKYVPERINLPNDRKARVTYVADASPYVSVRIQDLYDVRETPRIAMGRIPLVVHILGPNQRPVQVTQDLSGFWKEHYPRIKQEMQRKYPKHEWR